MKKILLILFIGFVFMQQSFAQGKVVSGKVTDRANSDALPGVTVVVKGTTTGTTTASDGTYSLTIPANGNTLVFSFIGYQALEQPIGNNTIINIALVADNKQLEEVLVVGYGSKTVRENTGSIGKVTGEKLSNEPLPTFTQALAGKTAGVQVGMNGGVLAEPTTIQIWGVNSITSSSQPLVVIDGVAQISSDNLNGLGRFLK